MAIFRMPHPLKPDNEPRTSPYSPVLGLFFCAYIPGFDRKTAQIG